MVTFNPSEPNTTVSAATAGRGVTSPEAEVTRNYVVMRSYLSWGAIIAGSLFTLSVLILSASLAFACGVPGYAGGMYGWGAGIWSVITAGCAFFCGGCLASYFASTTDNRFRFLHGIMSWGLTLPLLAFFMGVAGLWVGHTVLYTAGSQVGSAYVMTIGAAWGTFISLLTGLVFAAVGATTGSSMQDRMIMGSR